MIDKAESRVQQEIVRYFKNNYCTKFHHPRCTIFSVPNERKDTRELMTLIQTGLLSGVSDLIIVIPNKTIYCEVKTLTGTQQDNQKDFQKVVTDLGHEYWLVRSLEDFQKLITKENLKVEFIRT